MYLSTIAFKNIKRRKGKALLIVAGLAVGVAALVAISSSTRSFNESVSKELDAYGFNIVAYPASANLSLSYGGMNVSGIGVSKFKPLKRSDIDALKAMKESDGVAAVSPKALRPVEIRANKALVVGVDFKAESAVKKWWKVKGRLPNTERELLIGSAAAAKLGAREGEYLDIAGGRYNVTGVLEETGSQDDNVLFMDIESAWRALGRAGEIDIIEISAKSADDIDAVTAEAAKALPNATVSSVKQAVEYKRTAMSSLGRFGLAVTAVAVIVAGFVVFATMMGSVRDRTSEIGVFRAVGYRRRHVSKIIYIEAFALSLTGGILGSGIGSAFSLAMPGLTGIKGGGAKPDPLVFIAGICVSLAVGLAASALPARKAADMDPAEALKAL